MISRRPTPAVPAAFADLPVQMVTVGAGDEALAVHVAGRLGGGRTPLLCVAGYQRNMADFSAFVAPMQQALGTDWPVVLPDLRGRGRSVWRRRATDYTTTNDARDLAVLTRALGIESAIVLGQGHGGQVAMALAAERPTLVAGALLIDAGPATAPESLVRLRSNSEAIAAVRGVAGLTVMLRRMLATDYPGTSLETLDRLAARTHLIDQRGRATPLYDPALIERLADFAPDDVLVPQWPYFDLLARVPLMLLRTELTNQLPREMLEQMMARRPDAPSFALPRQGSPALLDGAAEIAAIADFIRQVERPAERGARRA